MVRASKSGSRKWNPTHGLPKFNSPSELKGSPWEVYLGAVYGSASIEDPSAFPIDVKELFALRTDHLRAAGLNLTYLSGNDPCPKRELELFERQSPWTPSPPLLWVFHNLTDVKPLSDDAWVEVTHKVRDDGMKDSERVGYWMYHAPGSGVSYNLRKTIAFNTHNEGVRYFVNATSDCYECDEYFARLCRSAKNKGFQSVQFLHHSDMRCGNTAIEVVDVEFTGNFQCLPKFYGGLGNSRSPCFCTEDDKYHMANCKVLPKAAHMHTFTRVAPRIAPPRGSTLIVGHSIYNTPRFSMVEDMKVATFIAARFEGESPSYLATELARLSVDVIAVQQDIGAFASDGKTLHTFLNIPGFSVAAACAAEQLHPSAGPYLWGGRVLANSLHVRRDKWEARSPQAVNVSAQCLVLRCAAIADIRLRDAVGEPRAVRIASTQLCGWHSFDKREQMTGERVTEIQKLTAPRPDVILGDMKCHSHSNALGAKEHAVAGSYSPLLRGVHHNLASEYLDRSFGAFGEFNASSYTRLLGGAPTDGCVDGDAVGQMWFRSGRFLGSGLDMVIMKPGHSLVHGVLGFRPDGAQLTREYSAPISAMLLPGVMFIAAGIVLNWRTRAMAGAGARATARSNSVRACGFAMFFLRGLCHTLLPLCFAAWVDDAGSLEVICYIAGAARIGSMLGSVCWGALIDMCMIPRVAAAMAHVVVAAGSLIMVRSVGGAHPTWIVAQFLLAFGSSAETPLTQHMLAALDDHENLGTQAGHMQVGGHLGGLYASMLFMACSSLESKDVLVVAYAVVLMLAVLISLSLWVCSALSGSDADSLACLQRPTLWERWQVTRMFKLVVLQGVLCVSAHDVGSFMLASVVSVSKLAVSAELSAIQCICSAVGASFFGRWSDQLARRDGHRARVVAGSVGCVVSMLAVASLSGVQAGGAGRWMPLMVCLLAAKSLSEDAAYVGITRPLLISETQPSCAATAAALKSVLDDVVAAFSGPLILWMARVFGYVGLDEPGEVAKHLGQGIAFVYITLRFMELAVYHAMRSKPKPT